MFADRANGLLRRDLAERGNQTHPESCVAFTQMEMSTENMTGVDAVYFSMVTMSTVGYGDISPICAHPPLEKKPEPCRKKKSSR